MNIKSIAIHILTLHNHFQVPHDFQPALLKYGKMNNTSTSLI